LAGGTSGALDIDEELFDDDIDLPDEDDDDEDDDDNERLENGIGDENQPGSSSVMVQNSLTKMKIGS